MPLDDDMSVDLGDLELLEADGIIGADAAWPSALSAPPRTL